LSEHFIFNGCSDELKYGSWRYSKLRIGAKMHKMRSVDSHGNNKNYCHQILSFKAKIHHIQFPLGLRFDPAGGAHIAPQTSYLNLKGYTE